MTLSEDDRHRVAAAIAAAEKNTSAELRAVEIAGPGLLHVAVLAGLVAVLLPGLLLMAGWRPNETWFTGGWTVIDPNPLRAIELYLATQAAFFVLVLCVAFLPWARHAPARWRRAWIRSGAITHFEALGMMRTRGRTGILIAVAPTYRTAAVVADGGIEGLPPALLRDAVEVPLIEAMKRDRLADGLVAAIEALGVLLASRAKGQADDSNELPDQMAASGPSLI